MIVKQKLSFYNSKVELITEPGMFDIMIGSSFADIKFEKTV